MVLRGRTSKTGLAILGCCFASVVWAGATAISGGLPVAVLAVLDSQAASYLAEERSTKVLRDTELLTEYSKRFAFVVHDIKNLASQLNLIVSNAKLYLDDPEFQRDMLRTVEDSVARMNNLLSQLKADAVPRAPPLVDPDVIVGAVVGELAGGPVVVETRNDAGNCAVAVDPDPPQIRSNPSRPKRDRGIAAERSRDRLLAPPRTPAADRYHRQGPGNGSCVYP